MIVDPLLSRRRFERDVQPLRESPDVFAAIGVRPVRIAFPELDVALRWVAKGRELLLRITAEDYDYRPPHGWWIDDSGRPLQQGQNVPNGRGFQPGGHPDGFTRAWLCFPGWREYHDHPGHQSPTWVSIRSQPAHRLPGIIVQLHSELNQPDVQGA